jgi:penicillin-binding protein 1A
LALLGVAAAILLTGMLFLMVYAGILGKVPSAGELHTIQNYVSSEVYSNDRVLLGKYYYQDRTNVEYHDLPDHLIEALVATEDARFYDHNGIDARSVFRVALKSILLQNRQSGGGSNIHQQLAKNLFPRKRYSIITMPVNKFREMIIGVRLHKAYSKKEILELYLNTVSFGENTYGIETASHRFFNKHPRDLTIEESALLVAMLKGTYLYNPRHFPERAKERRNLVLSLMHTANYLDQETVDSLSALPVVLDYVNRTHNEGLAPYFREHLRQVLLEWTEEHPGEDGTPYNIYTDGLKIYTTINTDLQRYAEKAVKEHMAYLQRVFDRQWRTNHPLGENHIIIQRNLKSTPQYNRLKRSGIPEEAIMDSLRVAKKMEVFTWQDPKEVEMSVVDSIVHYANFLHAGLLSVEAETGYVRAWVGGINSEYFKYDHVTSRRQAGSVFKPVIYAAALRNGHDPCSYLPNDSVVYEEYDNWTPRNSGRGYGGYYSMKGALTHSVNTISVHLLEETGIDEVIEFSQELGIESALPEVLSLALGTGSVSLEEMVRAYTVFPNEGDVVRPIFLKRIEDKNGKVLYENEPVVSEPVLEPRTAQLMTEMMKSVVDSGTASSLRTVYAFENEIAGKTGTTQQNTDGWFIGYTPVLITGVWVGGDHPEVRFRYGGYGQGASAALPIWARYMQYIYRDPLYSHSRELSFEVPESVKRELDCEDYLESDLEYRWEKRRSWIRRFFNFNNRRNRKN